MGRGFAIVFSVKCKAIVFGKHIVYNVVRNKGVCYGCPKFPAPLAVLEQCGRKGNWIMTIYKSIAGKEKIRTLYDRHLERLHTWASRQERGGKPVRKKL